MQCFEDILKPVCKNDLYFVSENNLRIFSDWLIQYLEFNIHKILLIFERFNTRSNNYHPGTNNYFENNNYSYNFRYRLDCELTLLRYYSIIAILLMPLFGSFLIWNLKCGLLLDLLQLIVSSTSVAMLSLCKIAHDISVKLIRSYAVEGFVIWYSNLHFRFAWFVFFP